jgi:hypothetical protein
MSERYQFTSRDKSLIEAGILLLRKLATAPMTKPGQLKTVTKVLEALLRLPEVPRGFDVSITVTSPTRSFPDCIEDLLIPGRSVWRVHTCALKAEEVCQNRYIRSRCIYLDDLGC